MIMNDGIGPVRVVIHLFQVRFMLDLLQNLVLFFEEGSDAGRGVLGIGFVDIPFF